jgi:hypothetical protein
VIRNSDKLRKLNSKDKISPMGNPFFHPNDLKRLHEVYVKGDIWRCSLSPSGAHSWEVNMETMECRYCYAKKSTWPEVVKTALYHGDYYHKKRFVQ